MKRAWLRQHGKGSLDLIEEAFHLLRRSPAGALAAYYLGALPFALGLLYFWADMSRSAFARQRLAGASLGLALLYLWMKFWQTIFARHLRARLAAAPLPPWTPRRCLRVAAQQTILQPSALLLLPAALVAVLPFGWAFSFYQNLTVLSDGETSDLKPLLKRAVQQSALWPGQNHWMLAALAGFGVCVFLNWLSAGYFLPTLLKSFLGVETAFTTSPASSFNSTFLAAMLALTWLVIDPLVKAVYTLRCFYGESLKSGEDLRAELRQLAGSGRTAACALLLGLGLALVTPAKCDASDFTNRPGQAIARPPASDQAASSIAASDLDRAVVQVMHQRKYSWRMPRTKTTEDDVEPGFLAGVWNWVKECLRKIRDWIVDVLERLFRSMGRAGGAGSGWITPLQGLLFFVIAVAACALALLVHRILQNRRRKVEVRGSDAIPTVPDLADEQVGADQLPEDDWMKLGRELLGRGEPRLALRAFYLSSLAHLAGRDLLTLARFKSNREYEGELQRRGHSFPELLPVFGENVSVFDRIWYGLDEATPDLLGRFVGNVEKIKTAR